MHALCVSTSSAGGGGEADKVMRSSDKNVDESANLRTIILGRTRNLSIIPCVAVWCLVCISKSKPEGINHVVYTDTVVHLISVF